MHFQEVMLPLALFFFLTCPDHSQGQVERRYSFVRLPSLGGQSTTARSINEQGDIVGAAFLPNNDYHPVLWINGEPFDLGTLNGGDGEAWGINNNGWIVGWTGNITIRSAFLWRDGHMEDIGSLGGDRIEARAVNDMGQIVGKSSLIPGEFESRGFLWEDGEMTLLEGFDEDSGGGASDINASGLVVGTNRSAAHNNEVRPALWIDGQIMDLGTLRMDNSGLGRAQGINDLGYIVGGASTQQSSNGSAFVWFDGRMYDLGYPFGSHQATGYAINNRGQVVGTATNDITGKFIAFLWEQGAGNRRLQDYAPPFLRKIGGLKFGEDINNAGQILGEAYPTGDPIASIAFVMSPVYPTMQLGVPTPGIAGEQNMLTIDGVTPGARVFFYYSLHGGGERIPGCDLQQNALQLDRPKLIGSSVADGNGVASVTKSVPIIAQGQWILMQAVVPNECAISQLVVHRFE